MSASPTAKSFWKEKDKEAISPPQMSVGRKGGLQFLAETTATKLVGGGMGVRPTGLPTMSSYPNSNSSSPTDSKASSNSTFETQSVETSPIVARTRASTTSAVPIGRKNVLSTRDSMEKYDEDEAEYYIPDSVESKENTETLKALEAERIKRERLRQENIERQKKLEEKSKELEEEERRLMEEEKKLQEERKKRLEEAKKFEYMLTLRHESKKDQETPDLSVSPPKKSETAQPASPVKQISPTPQPQSPVTMLTTAVTDREKQLTAQVATLKSTLENVTSKFVDVSARLDQELRARKQLEAVVEKQRQEIKQLKSILEGVDSRNGTIDERKVDRMKKLPKLFGGLKTDEKSRDRRGSHDEKSLLGRKRGGSVSIESTRSSESPPSSPSISSTSSPSGTINLGAHHDEEADKKLSLESITKADMIKEALSNKYSSFAMLRRNQMEQMETRRIARNRSNTLDNATLTNLNVSDGGTLSRQSREVLSSFLTNRVAKSTLEQQGILRTATFGTALENLQQESGIPVFLSKALNFLETKAFNLGNLFVESVDPTELHTLKQNAQQGDYDFNGAGASPYTVAALIIEFFRDLPEPLFPFPMYKMFVSWADIDDTAHKVSSLRSLIFSLKSDCRHILHQLVLYFLQYSKSGNTQQIIKNISLSFGPVLIRPVVIKNEDYLMSLGRVMNEANQDENIGETVLQSILTNYLSIFGESDDIKFIKKEGYEIASSGSLEKLVDLLLDEYYNEPNYAEIMLLTHQYYTTSIELLERLIQYHDKDCKAEWKKRRQARVIRILKFWVGTHSNMLKHQKNFVERLTNFCDYLPKKEIVFEKFLAYVNSPEEPKVVPPEPTDIPEVDILEIDAGQLAEQLTYIDHELLRAINVPELLKKSFLEPSKAPAFNAMVESWNKRSIWVTSEIIKRDKLHRRVNAICHFIKIAELCRTMNNFHCSYAIIAALNHVAVSRLEKTWEKVPKKQRATLESLESLFEMSFNYKKYRTALHAASPPAVPYLGIYPKDITSLEESPSMLSSTMINFSKFRELYGIINQIPKFQSQRYKLEKVENLNIFLLFSKPLTEKELLDLSDLYEPKKRKITEAIDTSNTPSPNSTISPTRPQSSTKFTASQVEEYRKKQLENYAQQQEEALHRAQLKKSREGSIDLRGSVDFDDIDPNTSILLEPKEIS